VTVGAHNPVGTGGQVRGYTLRRFLAQGGMAELFLAQPTDPARARDIVVVKRVLPQFVQDQQFARMFAREAALASMLKHPNIVEVYGDQGASDAECFFAMEYVHGPDLNMLLKVLKDGTHPIPLEHAIQIAMGMCAGLHHAHDYRGADGQQLSIVHRDVSPSNVMIASDGVVKITDFGVAKALALTSFTQAGTRKGKLSYMSPEQAVADPVDRRTDVFAIGTVLFEMTTLQRMFGGENELAVMHKLLFRERPRPSALRHDYPPELESILLKAVAQKPDDRFSSAQEMYQALHDFAQRRRLVSTPAHLARWVASIIPPKAHPATDPAFFDAQAEATVLPMQRDTIVASDATVSDSGLGGNATMLDGAGPLPGLPGQLPHAPQRTTVGMINPQTSPSFAPPPPSLNPAIVRRAPPSQARSSTLPAIAIVAGAVAVGAVILAGALWYADARKRDNSGATDTSADSDPETVETNTADAPEEREDDPPILIPGIIEPDQPGAVQPLVEAPSETPPASAVAPDPVVPEPVAPTAGKSKKKRPAKKKRPRAKPEPATTPKKAPAPQPKPEPKPEPKHSLDDLYPE